VSRNAIVLSLVTLTGFLTACTATTNITAHQQGAMVDIATTTKTNTPRSETLSATTFGNYEFRAQAPGFEPLYGILPLKFNGGYLALDILFFTPATFFNLREAYPFYDFDIAKRVVRFRKGSEDWKTYTPSGAESTRARKVYEKK
jgi:hypothetical protein